MMSSSSDAGASPSDLQAPVAGLPVTVRDLRRRRKLQKERLLTEQSDHSLSIRFHRAYSWLARTEAITDEADLDLKLIKLRMFTPVKSCLSQFLVH